MSAREPDLAEVIASLADLGGAGDQGPVIPLPIEVQPWLSQVRGIGGTQHIYRFDNGYGASVVQGHGSYGNEARLWELGVVIFTGDEWKLTYQTPITNDVIGWLTAEDVAGLLVRIAAL